MHLYLSQIYNLQFDCEMISLNKVVTTVACCLNTYPPCVVLLACAIFATIIPFLPLLLRFHKVLDVAKTQAMLCLLLLLLCHTMVCENISNVMSVIAAAAMSHNAV